MNQAIKSIMINYLSNLQYLIVCMACDLEIEEEVYEETNNLLDESEVYEH